MARVPAAVSPSSVTVRMSAPVSVTSTVCSNWAEARLSLVCSVQPSAARWKVGRPEVNIGSTVNVMPGTTMTVVVTVDVVRHVGIGVERCSDSVAAVFADDRVPPRFGERFDRFGDPLQRFERADRGDAAERGFASGFDESGERRRSAFRRETLPMCRRACRRGRRSRRC